MALPIVAYNLQPSALERRRRIAETEARIADEERQRRALAGGGAAGGGGAGGGGADGGGDDGGGDGGAAGEEGKRGDADGKQRSLLEDAHTSAVTGGRQSKSMAGRQVSRFKLPDAFASTGALEGALTVEGKPGLILGDVTSDRSSLRLATELLNNRTLEGIEQIVKNMNDTLADPEAQIKGITALGHIAARGSDIQVKRSCVPDREMGGRGGGGGSEVESDRRSRLCAVARRTRRTTTLTSSPPTCCTSSRPAPLAQSSAPSPHTPETAASSSAPAGPSNT
jgi:hypothetical protein